MGEGWDCDRLLELVVLDIEGTDLVIHAMPMRAPLPRLLTDQARSELRGYASVGSVTTLTK
jgi:hypothetical protein